MNPNPSIKENNNQNYNFNNNNISNNNNTHEKNTHSGNMYSYREDSINEPPKESNAIRRSLGGGFNPNSNPPFPPEASRTIPQRHIEQFPDSFHKMSDRNKNNLGLSSGMRIGPSQRISLDVPKIEDKPKPLYRRRNNNEDNNYHFITFIVMAFFHVIIITFIALFYEFNIGDNKEYNHVFMFFKDIHFFIFIGFGMLYSVLRDHQWSSIVIVLVFGVFAIEFSFFHFYFWENTFAEHKWSRVNLDYRVFSIIEYAAASSIVAIGALLGTLSLFQYFVIAFFCTFFFNLNFFIIHEKLKVLDNGGTISVYFFGAMFGLSASLALFCNEVEFMKINNNHHFTSNYYSSLFAFIGTLFLWLFFPSFNVANIYLKDSFREDFGFITENFRYRGIINTYLSMMGSCIAAFIVSPLFYNGKMKMEHILHASYVGGIIIAGGCTICPNGWCAIVVGFIGSTITILLLWKIKYLFHSIKFEDTIGVFEIFAIPGLLGGMITSIFFAIFKYDTWDEKAMKIIYGAKNNTRASIQAGLEIAGLFVSMGIAIFGGLVTGLIAKVMMWDKNENYFVDSEFFLEELGLAFPEDENHDERENNLNSSGNKLDYEGKEVNINNNKNNENNVNENNINDNNINDNKINNNVGDNDDDKNV